MTHTQYGVMVGDPSVGGVVEPGSCLLIREHNTVAIDTLSKGEALPALALELVARINKTDDTVGCVYMMGFLDAGSLARSLWQAAERAGEEASLDFRVGLAGAGDLDL